MITVLIVPSYQLEDQKILNFKQYVNNNIRIAY